MKTSIMKRIAAIITSSCLTITSVILPFGDNIGGFVETALTAFAAEGEGLKAQDDDPYIVNDTWALTEGPALTTVAPSTTTAPATTANKTGATAFSVKYNEAKWNWSYSINDDGTIKIIDVSYKLSDSETVDWSAIDWNIEGKVVVPQYIDGKLVTCIGSRAFWEYSDSFTSITLPESISNLEDEAFYGCFNLKEIIIKNSDCSIYDDYRTITCDSFTGKMTEEHEYDYCGFLGIIYGQAGSTAEKYADKYGYHFRTHGYETYDDDWKIAYRDFAREYLEQYGEYEYRIKNASFTLVDIDNNGIPEMFIDSGSGAGGSSFITYSDAGIEEVSGGNSSGVRYIPGSSVFMYSGGHQGVYYDDIYRINNGKFELVGSGDDTIVDWENDIHEYKWNDSEVTEGKYVASINQLFDTSKGKSIDEDNRYAYQDIFEVINRYKAYNSSLQWEISKFGILTISGKGSMCLNGSSAPWSDRADEIKIVLINDGITDIGTSAFENCINMTGIAIPNSVQEIGPKAFKGCSKLESITLPNGITTVPDETFLDCVSLKEVHFPRSLKTIAKDELSGCISLKDIYYGGIASDWEKLNLNFMDQVKYKFHFLDETYYPDKYIYEHLKILYEDPEYYGNSETIDIIKDYREMAKVDRDASSYRTWSTYKNWWDGDFGSTHEYNDMLTVELLVAQLFLDEDLNNWINENTESEVLVYKAKYLKTYNELYGGSNKKYTELLEMIDKAESYPENLIKFGNAIDSAVSDCMKVSTISESNTVINKIVNAADNEILGVVMGGLKILQVYLSENDNRAKDANELYQMSIACVAYHASSYYFKEAIDILEKSVKIEADKYNRITADDNNEFDRRMHLVGNSFSKYLDRMRNEIDTEYEKFSRELYSSVLTH